MSEADFLDIEDDDSDADAELAAPGENPLGYSGYALFAIASPDLNPDAVSMSLGMDPDRQAYAYGDREGYWQINSDLGANDRMEDHIWQIIQRLLPKRGELKRLSAGAKLEFYCAVQKEPDAIVHLRLPPRLLLFIGHLGANLVWDVSEK